MDLETMQRTKEKIIRVLNHDINDLHKAYKYLKILSKEQQAQIQKFISASEKLKIQMAKYKTL